MTSALHPRLAAVHVCGYTVSTAAVVFLALLIPAVPASGGTRGRATSRPKKSTPIKSQTALHDRQVAGGAANKVAIKSQSTRSKRAPSHRRAQPVRRRTRLSSQIGRSITRPAVSLKPVPVSSPAPGSNVAPQSPPAQPPTTVEGDIITLTNQARQSNGLAPLAVDDRLTRAALIQAGAMATFNVMDHTLPGATLPTLASRLQYVGYGYLWAGENIACNAPDASTVESLWLNSPPHRANILNPGATSIGVAVAYSSLGEPYFCQVFGQPGP